ncbi:hypothetical protein [Spirosoma sp.]|uniref:hypothetical protein n=1 Tax=Spirosoma sp. TaxID=1899569 RepID=UPI00261BF7E5|nr:hypothetical protein [Spirosoma sp.]MCX6217580.1 hypothetical protein [Spirosoma sp.]
MSTKTTPGPWYWILNPANRTLELESASNCRTTIFRPVRWGMQRATLQFNKGNIMHDAISFGVPIKGREHHKDWALDINHPDAKLIAAAPDLLDALTKLAYRYQAEVFDGHEDEEYSKAIELIVKLTE